MPTREQLHRLLDSLPEEAIEAAYRALSQFQVWPPQLTPQIEELRHMYEKRLKEVQEAQGEAIGGVGIGGGSAEWPLDHAATLKSGYWSFDRLDGEALVVETHRYKDGHELAIVERIAIKDEHLIYKHEITGPRGKRDEWEIVFDVS